MSSKNNFILAKQNLHNIVIKTNFMHVGTRRHHIDTYQAFHKQVENTMMSCIRNINIVAALEHLHRTSFKSHLCNAKVKYHSPTNNKQLPLGYPC